MKRFAWLLVLLAACREAPPQTAAGEPLGDPDSGKQLIARHGCTVCHQVPGISGPQGKIGPHLGGMSRRPTLSAAAVPNTPDNLVQFIQSPASLNPRSTMPGMGLPAGEARDIAAYLWTLR